MGIQADAASALSLMADLASEQPVHERDAFLSRLAEARAAWFERLAEWTNSESMPMTTSRVLTTLRAALPLDAAISSAAGHAQAQVLQELPLSVARTNITAAGFSTMGFTVPAVLGAKLGRPDRASVGICGDGDFLMSCQELATAAQLGLNVIFVVLNNHGWNSIRDLQSAAYGEARTIATQFDLRSGESHAGPDLVALSEALGVPAVRAQAPDEILGAVGRGLASDGPALIEIPVQRAYPESAGPTSGWWDVPVPSYLEDRRAEYEEVVGAMRHDPVQAVRSAGLMAPIGVGLAGAGAIVRPDPPARPARPRRGRAGGRAGPRPRARRRGGRAGRRRQRVHRLDQMLADPAVDAV